ncbi:MAG: hypothetical protein M3072_09220 [Candidatus Dormibacteraeota bacterium]|nr:hypothetical protein [Candidatus Dormibacteraeota bacterium]
MIRTILPQIVQLGVATQDEVGVETLADRLQAELADDGAAVTWGFITAWALRETVREGCGVAARTRERGRPGAAPAPIRGRSRGPGSPPMPTYSR